MTERNYCSDNDHGGAQGSGSGTHGSGSGSGAQGSGSGSGAQGSGSGGGGGAQGSGGGAQGQGSGGQHSASGGGSAAHSTSSPCSKLAGHEGKCLHQVAIPLRAPCVMPSPLQYTTPPQPQGEKIQCVEVGLQTSLNSAHGDVCGEVSIYACMWRGEYIH